MRLWQPELLHTLPGALLCALHRDVCLVRSGDWKSPRNAGSWAWLLPWGCIAWYHSRVLKEMQARGWKPSLQWLDPLYRGKKSADLKEGLFSQEDMSPAQWRQVFRKACPETIAAQREEARKWEEAHASD